MAVERVPSPRTSITRNTREVRIEIRGPRELVDYLGSLTRLAGWAAGQVVLAHLFRRAGQEGNAPLVLGLVCWTFVGLSVLSKTAWELGGREIIKLTSGMLTIQRTSFGMGPAKSYFLADVSDLRVALPAPYRQLEAIAFDYESDTVRFGERLVATEAQAVVEELRSAGIGTGPPGMPRRQGETG